MLPLAAADLLARAPGPAVDVRPPPGIARGLIAVPAWVVLTLTAALFVGTAVYLWWRGRREARAMTRRRGRA